MELGNVNSKIHWRREVVYMLLAGVFLGSLTMLNILGVSKMIDISGYLGADEGRFMLPVGVLAYPATFLCTDIISELYGKKRANLIVWIGLFLNLWVFFILWVGGVMPPGEVLENGEIVQDSNGYLFYGIRSFALGGTMASMIAYLLAQFCDVQIFHFLKKATNGKYLWLRNNGSTLVSQLVDSFAVIFVTYWFVDGALPLHEDSSVLSQLLMFVFTGYVFQTHCSFT